MATIDRRTTKDGQSRWRVRIRRRGYCETASFGSESEAEQWAREVERAIERGEWRHSGNPAFPVDVVSETPGIYHLYEENIGPLTPIIAETLEDAESTYPYNWIEEAVRIAVENNVRRWSYVEAILKRWQEGGRDEREDRRDTEKDRRRYVEGEFSDFIEH